MNRKNNMKLNNNENSDPNNISCPLCCSKLIFKYINPNTKMLFCSKKNCIFPMNSTEMDKFIFSGNKNEINGFFNSIKKLISDQTLSNDTNFEEKIKQSNKDDSQHLDYSDINSINDKNNFFDSFNENEEFSF